MLTRIAKALMVAALVFTLGGHWAVLQVVAWAGMAANFSQSDSFTVAIEKTFNGENPCQICKLVDSGKKSEKQSEANLDTKKLESSLADANEFYFPPLPQLAAPFASLLPTRSESPLSPPPRHA